MNTDRAVYVIDDDPSTRAFLMEILAHMPYKRVQFASVESFLADIEPSPSGCLVLDVRLPGMSGLDFMKELSRRELPIPIVMISGFGDVQMAVESMRLGAIDFIEKPIRAQQLLDSVQWAMSEAERIEKQLCRKRNLEQRFEQLTEREHEVVDLVVQGLTNKAIATKLQVSPQAIDARRINALAKLQVLTIAELVQCVYDYRSDHKLGPAMNPLSQ